MAGFTATEQIAGSLQDIFDFIINPENASKVLTGVIENVQITDGPIQVGTRFRETRRLNNKETSMELEVVTFEPPHRYAAAGTQMGVTATYHYTLTPEEEGTRVDLEAEVTTGLLMKLMLPTIVKEMQKQDGDHLQMLKAAFERELAA
ncbi:MAG: SRPBCC family protein [Chloroflexota bacterium]